MSQSRTDLKTGDIKSHLIRMTIPMIWGIAAMVSLQLADTYYISLLGTQKLAAITFTFPITFFAFTIIMGFGIAMSSVVSRLIGEGREEDVRRVATHGLMLVGIVGLALGIGGYLLRDAIFGAMGAGADLVPLVHQYMDVWFFGVIFLAMPFVGNAAIRASGNARAPAIIMVGMAVLNALITPLLVFGLFGLPRLELQGAAIGTVISQAVAMLAGLYILKVQQKMLLPVGKLHLSAFGDSCKRLLFIAIPAGLTSAIGPFVNSIIIAHLATFGAEAVAAFGIATRIEAFGFVILMALAVGMGPIIGQNFGAKQFERVERTLRMAIGFSVLWSIGTALVLIAFGESIAGAFSDDSIVVYYTKMSFLIIAPSYLFQALVNGWSSAFNALGKPQMSVVMTVVKMLVLMIPAVIVGANIGGILGIFTAIAIVNVISGLAFHWWSRRVLKGMETGLVSAAA